MTVPIPLSFCFFLCSSSERKTLTAPITSSPTPPERVHTRNPCARPAGKRHAERTVCFSGVCVHRHQNCVHVIRENGNCVHPVPLLLIRQPINVAADRNLRMVSLEPRETSPNHRVPSCGVSSVSHNHSCLQ